MNIEQTTLNQESLIQRNNQQLLTNLELYNRGLLAMSPAKLQRVVSIQQLAETTIAIASLV